ncbi:diacylglycerol/lipid kinase family protein [Geoglobus acetivorans]|uniref:DAGKc domain-containing protein n=1 Tax=Geoglobus acetivorans TaxID=565033 RepID=A0A0A7GH77_GEOAI|nr:hypothetical protein GACE_1242 [Geoglobus acetivorans]
MKLGVVVNPKAGDGPDPELVRNVVSRLEPDRVVTGQDDLGQDYLDNADIVEIHRTFDRNDTIRLVKELDSAVDVIAVFGGDGTASDAASAFPEKPLLCIPMGTTNAGPLMCNPEFKSLEVVEVDGLYIPEYGRVAFNDVVAGPTILGTVDGEIAELDALSYMRGEMKKGNPDKFYVRVSEGERTIEGVYGNVFVSMLDQRYLAKGISGGASISAFAGFNCLVACLSHTIVLGSITKEILRNMEPVRTETMSFDSSISLYAETVISADGNPFAFRESVTVEFRKNLVRVLKQV